MRGKAHLACGIISGAAISAVCHFDILSSLLITGASAFFSLVPDIDHPDSMLGHLIKPVSKFIKEKIGHRTLTHSGLWLIFRNFFRYASFGPIKGTNKPYYDVISPKPLVHIRLV